MQECCVCNKHHAPVTINHFGTVDHITLDGRDHLVSLSRLARPCEECREFVDRDRALQTSVVHANASSSARSDGHDLTTPSIDEVTISALGCLTPLQPMQE